MRGLTASRCCAPPRPSPPNVDVILLTAFGTVEEAVKA